MRASAVPGLSSAATAPAEISALSLHDALPISPSGRSASASRAVASPISWRSASLDCVVMRAPPAAEWASRRGRARRSEEHTSELQTLAYLVCRLLLEKIKV